jgi:uncharacterized protein YifN (PemK superfamily)
MNLEESSKIIIQLVNITRLLSGQMTPSFTNLRVTQVASDQILDQTITRMPLSTTDLVAMEVLTTTEALTRIRG